MDCLLTMGILKMCEIIYEDVQPNEQYESTIKKVLKECYEVENLVNSKLIVTVTFTTPENIRKINNKYRNIDRATDVLSFPMFEKDELDKKIKEALKEYKKYEHFL